LIDDLPTSKALGVFIGLAELKGTAESESPLTSRLAEIPCVRYDWRCDEHWSRTVTETYHDSQGRTQTRTRHESGWKTVAEGGGSAPFYLRDHTGVIRIVPDGARIEDKEVFDKTVTPSSPLYFGKGPAKEIANSAHRRRFVENAIPLHTGLYVMGQARERQDMVAAEIARDNKAPLFIISTRTEKQVSSGYGIWLGVMLALGLASALGGAIADTVARSQGSPITWLPVILAGLGFILVLGIGFTWTVYNSLVSLRQRTRQAWAQVDVQIKRRNDLIPNLVQIVDSYRRHEREVQLLVADLRGQAVNPAPDSSARGLTLELRAVAEQYPDLKSSEMFLKLQQSLSETEQRIALARDYYNDIASFYNARLEIVPDRFLAAMTRFKPHPLLTAWDFERAAVPVKLAE
jgi:hypothetical protein